MAANTSKKNIFVSYRVKDTQLATGRLMDALKQHIDEGRIFMDIDKIEPGFDFTQVISKYLDSSEIMLAIIGPDWMAYNPEKNNYRIHEPNDWVRKEVASALKRNIRVIPVLMDGATMPEEDQLPDDLKPLLLRQAFEISNKRWKYDSDQLISTLLKTLGETLLEGNLSSTNLLQVKSATGEKKKSGTTRYVIIATAALLLVWAISKMLGETTNEGHSPQPVVDSSLSINGKENSVDGRTDNSSTKAITNNITGTWVDPVGKGTFIFNQEGEQLSMKVYSVNNEQTGSGTGYIAGQRVVVQATLFLMGQSLPTEMILNLNDDEIELNGQIKLESNGAAYTEKVRLVRQ